MQRLRAGEVVSPDRVAQVRQYPRLQISDCVHQAARADRHHRETQFLEADKDAKVGAEHAQGFGDEAEIVHGVLHSDEARRLRPQLLQRIDRHVDRGSARYVVDHPRQVANRGKLEVVSNESSLRRPNVVRSYDQQGIGARLRRMLGELPRLA